MCSAYKNGSSELFLEKEEEADIHYTKKGKAATPKKGSKTAFFRTKQCGLFNARLRSHCVKESLGRIDFATLSRFLQHSKINGNGLAIQCANIDAYSDSEAKSSHEIQKRMELMDRLWICNWNYK